MGDVLSGFTGLCAGVVSGSALCAFYIALGVLSKSAISLRISWDVKWTAAATALGGVAGTAFTLFDMRIPVGQVAAGLFGLLSGVYVGIFIACLAEVTNMMPMLKKYAMIRTFTVLALLAFAAGKMAGSLVYWLFGGF